MATAEVDLSFITQIKGSRKKIRDCLKKSHEALRLRESTLLSRIDQIEKDYNNKTQEMNSLVEALNKEMVQATETLSANKLAEAHKQINEQTAETGSSIEFEWDNQFETDIEQLGSIKLNTQTKISPTHSFLPQVKPVVPDYKAKQLPIACGCKNDIHKKVPGELNGPRGIAVLNQTGDIYIADYCNHRVQVFSSNGDYLFMFSEKMNKPIVRARRELIKSVGSYGNGKVQFYYPHGVDVSDRNNNVYVCDSYNNRIQILTQELKFHSILGIGMFKYPRDVKVRRDRVLVLDKSDPCMFVFNPDHDLINRLITRGDGKQTNKPLRFDIDRDYNIIMSDYCSHCVYVFNQEGEQIHKFGKKGQGIGEFYYPFGIALDNTGHIIVVCQKNINCLQFF
ncbi:hypothetical protein LOD99_6461 [Oopsacas minuta]|uniref:Uncharacterized protein n=1 Tax=Oopsacas minuta TaxID=111878 RepID=A0AAV7JMF8_9METZ|nr:hypothetical protein LOD99_6461 [Oopsacas minuta]